MPAKPSGSAFNVAEDRHSRRMVEAARIEQFDGLRVRIQALEQANVALKTRVQKLETDWEDGLCQNQDAVEHN